MKNLYLADSAEKKERKENGLKKAVIFAIALTCMAGVLGNAAPVLAGEVVSAEDGNLVSGHVDLDGDGHKDINTDDVPTYDYRSVLSWSGKVDGSDIVLKNHEILRNACFYDGTNLYYIDENGKPFPVILMYGDTDEKNFTVVTVPHYDIRDGADKGGSGTWDGTHYYLVDGTMAKDVFFCDGTYTYYLQADGTPMTDRLTYHPDGKHVIYFDSEGHEVFSDFANVKKSIAGDAVDDYCFFDVYGYMYVDVFTYDKAGVNLYYANACGVLERNGWFTTSASYGRGVGYANTDGTLMVNQYTYDPNGNYVYIQGNGIVQGTGLPATDEAGNVIYWGRGPINPNVVVETNHPNIDSGSHGKIEFHDGYITYGGYAYPIENINATSANFHGEDRSGSETGNSWYNGVDFAGVFSAEFYCLKRSIREAGGYNLDNVINHYMNDGIYDVNFLGGGGAKFYPTLYFENYKDTGLFEKYGCDFTYYVLDYLAYGYAEGKTDVLPS